MDPGFGVRVIYIYICMCTIYNLSSVTGFDEGLYRGVLQGLLKGRVVDYGSYTELQ